MDGLALSVFLWLLYIKSVKLTSQLILAYFWVHIPADLWGNPWIIHVFFLFFLQSGIIESHLSFSALKCVTNFKIKKRLLTFSCKLMHSTLSKVQATFGSTEPSESSLIRDEASPDKSLPAALWPLEQTCGPSPRLLARDLQHFFWPPLRQLSSRLPSSFTVGPA